MRVNEIIKLEVNGKTIEVRHDGIKAYKDWTNESKDDLFYIVKKHIDKGETEFWMPFANLEASVSFNINQ